MKARAEARGAAERIRVGFIGCGRIADLQCLGYLEHPRAEIVAVCDPVTSKLDLAKRFLDVPFGFESFDELLAMDGLDVVNVCTPPGLHVEMCERALESGRDVVCEKPLAGSLAEVDALARCERESGRRLMPIFQYRFGRGVERLRRVPNRWPSSDIRIARKLSRRFGESKPVAESS